MRQTITSFKARSWRAKILFIDIVKNNGAANCNTQSNTTSIVLLVGWRAIGHNGNFIYLLFKIITIEILTATKVDRAISVLGVVNICYASTQNTHAKYNHSASVSELGKFRSYNSRFRLAEFAIGEVLSTVTIYLTIVTQSSRP